MAGPPIEDFPIVGPRTTVDLADWSGRSKTVRRWRSSLSLKEQTAFSNRFQRLCQVGSLPEPLMKHLGEHVHEILQRSNWRAACFKHENRWLISHFFKTAHRPKRVQKERRRAQRARDEHLERHG